MRRTHYGVVLLGVVIATQSSAAVIVDVYGTNPNDAKRIERLYGKDVQQLEQCLFDDMIAMGDGHLDEEKLRRDTEKKANLIARIRQKEHLAYVDLQTVSYPETRDMYTTIEVIRSDDRTRERFLAPNKPLISAFDTHQSTQKGLNKPRDIVQRMKDQTEQATTRFVENKLVLKNNCPLFHCPIGYNDPYFAKDMEYFSKHARSARSYILTVLQKDNDPERRAAAAFLVGYFADPHDILRILSVYVLDPQDSVRNNAIRVIVSTMLHAHITAINIQPFLTLLHSPYTTDRNKSLYVLLQAADEKKNKKQIMLDGGDTLLALLRLKQLNNHEPAYQILKKISGKDFGEYNIKAWQQWLDKAKRDHA